MSIYLRSPYNATDGIVIGYSVYHKILHNYMKEHELTLNDLLYSRSPEYKEQLYDLANEKKIRSLTQHEYDSLPKSTRPTESTY